jgi:hypothetical protein
MRVIIAFAVVTLSISLGGCSHRYQMAYAMPPSPWPLPRVASLAAPPLPTRRFPKRRSPMPNQAAYAKSQPSRVLPHAIKASLVETPPLPDRKSPDSRSPMPPSKSQSASGLPPATAKHYVVLDAVGNCAVIDAKPEDGLKIIGDSGGYASWESANKAMKDAKAKCKDIVGAGVATKFEAAEAKAKKNGVETLTRDDIDGLSYEQIKQLRGY